jgi:autotransporter-associated beta strand protein
MMLDLGFRFLPLTWKLNAESKNQSLTKKATHTSRFATLLLSLGISILLSGLFAPQMAQAADGTWTGTSGATWNTSAINWSGLSGTPWDSTNGSGNTAIFSSGANATVSGGSNVYVNNITFNANTSLLYTSPPQAVVTLAGANATINAATGTTSIIKTVLDGSNGLIKIGGGTVVLEPGDGWWSNTLSGDITINGGQLTSIRATSLGDGAGAIIINSGGTLSVDWTTVTRTGPVTVNGGVLRTDGGSPQLINNGAGFVLQNGGSITTSLGGSGGLTVNGARSYLYSANTYTGATVINAGGDLALAYGGDLPTDTALELSGVLLANNKNHTVGGLTGASTGLYYGDAAGTFTVNKVSGTDSYGGIIQNVGTFIKDGAGTLSLTHTDNNTTFPGALTVNNGVLELGEAGRFAAGSYSGAVSLSSASSVLQIATSADQTLGGAISGSGSLIKSGAGILTVSGSNSYSGETTVNAGKLNVNANMTLTGAVTVNGGELGTGNGSTLTNNGGGFVLTGSSAAAAVVLAGSGGLTVSSPDARLWAQATYSGATTVNSGQLNICGYGGISTNSAVSIASGATVDLTSFYAPENINRTIGGLTGAGNLFGRGGTVTVNKASGTDIFSGVISGGTGLIKEGASALALAGANNYTGTTAVNAGTLALANGSGLGSTEAGTTVASGAQLRFSTDTTVSSGFTVGNEALTISGPGVNNGGALRNVFGNNTYQGKITLAADATIGSAGGYSLTLDVASGNAIEAADRNLTIDGAGATVVNDGINLGTGGIVKTGSGITTLSGSNSYSGTTTVTNGTLVISNASLSATILSNSVAVAFVAAPSAGNYAILPGALAGNSLASKSVTGLSSGQTATVANSPNLVVQVTDGPTVPTFEDTYKGINPLAINPANGLSYLMNYALGGTGPDSNPAVPVLTSSASSLTLTANIRNSGQGVSVVGQYAYDLAGPWTDMFLTATGASSSVANTTVKSFSQAVESNKPRKFLRLKATQNQ